MSAKGSNAYIRSAIIAFYNAPSPALFGELGALNTRFGRSDLVRLFYTDRFDQTCGRNRGFRGEEGGDHKAVFPPRLHSWPTGHVWRELCWGQGEDERHAEFED